MRRDCPRAGVDAPDDITRLHGILNDPGSFAHLAAYMDKFVIPAAGQRAALKELQNSLEKPLRLIEQLDWQPNEGIMLGRSLYSRLLSIALASSSIFSETPVSRPCADWRRRSRLPQIICILGVKQGLAKKLDSQKISSKPMRNLQVNY